MRSPISRDINRGDSRNRHSSSINRGVSESRRSRSRSRSPVDDNDVKNNDDDEPRKIDDGEDN